MACSCGGKRAAAAAAVKYVYKAPNGQQTTYDSQFEARARVLRDGGTWDRVPVTA